MRRITIGGPALSDFPPNAAGSYVKLLIPKPEGDGHTYVRTYTIRHYRPEANEIDLDIVLHGDFAAGPGTLWAANAGPGDPVAINGPGAGTMVDRTADWFFLVGDLTAVPAISANLECLDSNVRGYVVIEVPDLPQRPQLPRRDGIAVVWATPGESTGGYPPLIGAARSVRWLKGRPFVWAACDFDQMKDLRQYFKRERGLSSKDLYISSYWKKGVQEEQHKAIKRADADLETASP